MPIEFTNRQEKGSPLTMLEMDAILDLIKDFANGLEALMGVSLNPDGTLRYPGFFAAASTNGTDSYTATVPGAAAQSDFLGKLLVLRCDVANAGPASLNANGYGSFPIVRFQDVAMESNYIKAGQYIFLTWNGTAYVLQSAPGVVTPENYALDSGSANNLIVTQAGNIFIPETLYPGYSIRVKVAAANTGPAQIVLQAPPSAALPAVAIKRSNGSALVPGNLVTGQIVDLVYDGVSFQVPALVVRSFAVTAGLLSTYTAGNAGAEFAHGLSGEPDMFQVGVICTDVGGDAGYSQNDVIDSSGVQFDFPDNREIMFSPYANATKVGVSVNALPAGGGSVRFEVMHKTTGAETQIDQAKWKLRLKAFLI